MIGAQSGSGPESHGPPQTGEGRHVLGENSRGATPVSPLPHTDQLTSATGERIGNLDPETVAGFGAEWEHYDQSRLTPSELASTFERYFAIFPWNTLPKNAVGFDLGCGSGRWARLVAPRVGRLHCIDASERALRVASRNLAGVPNCEFHLASVDSIPLPDGSADFGYSLGVLHHVPDTVGAIRSCVEKLKPGAPLLLYLYYALENRPRWFRSLWQASEIIRRQVSRLPSPLKIVATQVIATGVYFPLARVSGMLDRLGIDVSSVPLSFYRHHSFYTMRTDALDRFGTRLEQRFTAAEIKRMMEAAGLDQIRFHSSEPFWCAVGLRRRNGAI